MSFSLFKDTKKKKLNFFLFILFIKNFSFNIYAIVNVFFGKNLKLLILFMLLIQDFETDMKPAILLLMEISMYLPNKSIFLLLIA